MRKIKIKRWIGGLLLSNILTVIGLIYVVYQQPKFVVFDIKKVTDTFLKQVIELKLPEEQGKKLVRRYERTLNTVITEYEKEHNTIILVKNAVVSNLDDKTNEIKKEIAGRMKSGTELLDE